MASTTTYIKTATHNYVSRDAIVENPNQVELKGKSVLKAGSKVRGDLAMVRMGRYCLIESGTTLQPSPLGDKYVPLILRGNVQIEQDCQIEASAIGTNVYIGKNCQIGKRCIIKDNCWIEEGTILGNDTVIPPFSRVRGAPGFVVEELPPSASVELQEMAQAAYQTFVESGPKT